MSTCLWITFVMLYHLSPMSGFHRFPSSVNAHWVEPSAHIYSVPFNPFLPYPTLTYPITPYPTLLLPICYIFYSLLLCPPLPYPLLPCSLQVLLFVVDGAGGDGGESGGNNPASDLRCLWKELKLYDEALLTKPKILFINKSDLECKNVLYYIPILWSQYFTESWFCYTFSIFCLHFLHFLLYLS